MGGLSLPSMLVKIYGLVDPRDGAIRYIGKTRCELRKRLCEHCQDRRLRHNRHKINWIKSLERDGLRPDIVLLEECEERVWQRRERHWIAVHRATLTNVEPGGNGSTWIRNRRITEPQRTNISETLKRYYRDNVRAREVCAAAGRSSRGIPKKIKNKTSKYVGVSYRHPRPGGNPLRKPWSAMISIDWKPRYLGLFSTEEEAARAYDARAKQLGWPNLNFPN